MKLLKPMILNLVWSNMILKLALLSTQCHAHTPPKSKTYLRNSDVDRIWDIALTPLQISNGLLSPAHLYKLVEVNFTSLTDPSGILVKT